MNTATRAIFTTLHFLSNLNGPNKLVLHYSSVGRLAKDKNSQSQILTFQKNTQG
jgi:hypothetical protein